MSTSPQVLLVRAPNPGPLTGTGTNTWIYGHGETVVIDPGPADETHLELVLETATRLGRVVVVALSLIHI